MTYYLIDYENVGTGGLKGATGIAPEDRVLLLYNVNSRFPVSSIHLLKGILDQFEFRMIRRTANNYLDFYLAATVGKITQMSPGASIVIISRDKGYYSIVDFCTDNNVKASCFPSIETYLSYSEKELQSDTTLQKEESSETEVSGNADTGRTESRQREIAPTKEKKKSMPQKAVPTRTSVPESLRKKVREALQKDKVQAYKYTQIYKAFLAGSRKQFLASLSESFGKENGLNYYQKILPVFREFIK